MSTSEKVQSYNVGKSDYSKHVIQPWDIWKEYNLNPWDADIVKRVLRSKEGEERTLDYEKIIHICKYRIAQLSKEVLKETKVDVQNEDENPLGGKRRAEKKVFFVRKRSNETEVCCTDESDKSDKSDKESDDTTVLCLAEAMKPAMFYIEGIKWGGKYIGYSVFMSGNSPYMYLGVDAEGNHLYADLSEFGQWLYTREAHLPPKTFELNCTNLFGNHRSSLKIGHVGTNYEKHDYIITAEGYLLRYFGMRGEKFSYRNMSAKRADGTYPEFISICKLENKAIQFTL